MKMNLPRTINVTLPRAIFTLLLFAMISTHVAAQDFLVIAHRGASGYLPEHTLEATALAYGMGSDYIEQDVVLTKDNQAIVLHDIHLDTVTDVAQLFPGRNREDGRYYAIDFTLAEVQTLSVHERVDHKTGNSVFAARFPQGKSKFRIPTLSECIELIQGLNTSSQRDVGIYPEIKKPKWHREQGKDISKAVLAILSDYGYRTKTDSVFLQCFDPVELNRIREELDSKMKLVQLIGSNEWNEADVDYTEMVTKNGIREIAKYADGIGPWMQYIVEGSEENQPQITALVETAHAHGLLVHPFTFRADSLPEYENNYQALVRLFRDSLEVDGLFTDFPDRTLQVKEQK